MSEADENPAGRRHLQPRSSTPTEVAEPVSSAVARQAALDCILSFWTYNDDHPVILDQATIERDFGWMFFWQSKRALDGDQGRRLIGNGPIIVNRLDASVCCCGSGRSAEFYLDRYAAASPTERKALTSIL